MLLIFGAVFGGGGVFAWVSITDMGAGGVVEGVTVAFGGFFLLVFGGVGALMMLLGLYSLVNSLVVEIRNGKVTARRSFFCRSVAQHASTRFNESRWTYTAAWGKERSRRPT